MVYIQTLLQSVRNRQATQWENGGNLVRDFVQKEENKMAKKKKDDRFSI